MLPSPKPSLIFLLLHNYTDGCIQERTCHLNSSLLCVDWQESDISRNQYILTCPCGSFSNPSVYNRKVTRRCTGNFDSRAAWEPPNFEDCTYTDRVFQLCRLLNSVSFQSDTRATVGKMNTRLMCCSSQENQEEVADEMVGITASLTSAEIDIMVEEIALISFIVANLIESAAIDKRVSPSNMSVNRYSFQHLYTFIRYILYTSLQS